MTLGNPPDSWRRHLQRKRGRVEKLIWIVSLGKDRNLLILKGSGLDATEEKEGRSAPSGRALSGYRARPSRRRQTFVTELEGPNLEGPQGVVDKAGEECSKSQKERSL